LHEMASRVQTGRKLRGEPANATPDHPEEGKDEGTSRHANEAEIACKKEYKLCVNTDSASFVMGCEGLGEIEISTDGKISASLALPTKEGNSTDK